MRSRLIAAALVIVAATGEATPALSQSSSVWDGAYTAAQADRGAIKYRQECVMCHGPVLEGNGETPPLTGRFIPDWAGTRLSDLFEKIQTTMPLFAPGTLSASRYRRSPGLHPSGEQFSRRSQGTASRRCPQAGQLRCQQAGREGDQAPKAALNGGWTTRLAAVRLGRHDTGTSLRAASAGPDGRGRTGLSGASAPQSPGWARAASSGPVDGASRPTCARARI